MERENHNIDKNEQFTHQRIIRDETKKTGAGTQSGDDKCFLYTFILGGIFSGLLVLPGYTFILSKMWELGGPTGKVMVCLLGVITFFAGRFLVHFFLVHVHFLYSELRHKQLFEGVGQVGDIVVRLYPDGGATNFSSQVEESKLMQTHPRIEPPKGPSEEENIMYYYAAYNGDIPALCDHLGITEGRAMEVLEPFLALRKAGMLENEEGEE